MKEYNYENFMCSTFANYQQCEPLNSKPNFWSFSGSTYWYLEDGIVRWSDHWGKVNTCIWYLDGKTLSLEHSIYGYCSYDDFHPISFREDWLSKFYLEVGECGSVEDKSTGWLVRSAMARGKVS